MSACRSLVVAVSMTSTSDGVLKCMHALAVNTGTTKLNHKCTYRRLIHRYRSIQHPFAALVLSFTAPTLVIQRVDMCPAGELGAGANSPTDGSFAALLVQPEPLYRYLGGSHHLRRSPALALLAEVPHNHDTIS